MTRRRLFDWRLVSAFAVLLLIAVVAWKAVQQQEDLDARGERVNTLIAQGRQADHDAAQDRAASARDREAAAANQAALLAYTKALADRQDALLTYLRVHGIDLPDRLVATIPAPTIKRPRHAHHTRSSSTTRHRSQARLQHPSAHRRRHAAPAPTGPGKSGSAPGHTKHGHHHGHKGH